MAAFVKGDVVILPFPYSDLSQSKRRPAVIVAILSSGDVILCQVTTQNVTDADALPLDNADFTAGGLNQASNIRPNKIFTADSRIILYQAGKLKSEKLDEVVEKLTEIIHQ